MKTAIITGCLGMDGSHLADFLRSMNYHVVGITQRHSSNALSYGHLSHLRDDPHFELYHGNILDPIFITDLLCKYQPDEYYDLAAASHVGYSFTNPIEVFNVDATATVLQLGLIQKHSPDTKFYFACTSEVFGGLKCPTTGYTEESQHHPRSPYGVAKEASYWSTVNFREAYNLYACNGILFNHTGPRRGYDFVERKITSTVAKIKLGLTDKIKLGNIDAYRDLGASKDYIKAQWLMLQQDKPVDYLVATGQTYQIREILDNVFKLAELPDYEQYIEFDQSMMRPSEVPYLLGNPTKIKEELGWETTYNLQSILEEMYKNDIDLLGKQNARN